MAKRNAARPKGRKGLSPWTHLAIAIIVIVAVQAFVVKLYHVPSGSMEQTFMPGDRVVVDRTGFINAPRANGDTVVFVAPSWDTPVERGVLSNAVRQVGDVIGIGPTSSSARLKRIVAGPGQTVECCDSSGQILVNGASQYEPYVWNNFPFSQGSLDCATEPRSQRCFGAFTVPVGSYVVLGDNRLNSADSVSACREPETDVNSCIRVVRTNEIVGGPIARLWPLNRMSFSVSSD